MYVSKRRPAKLPVIEYDLQTLQSVDSFKYPGVKLSASNNLRKGMKAVCQQASKSQTIIDMHVLKHQYLHMDVLCGAQVTTLTLKHTTTNY